MVDFLLIHGGAHGAWCWQKVIPVLESDKRTRHIFACDLADNAQEATGKVKAEITNTDYVTGVVKKIEELDLRDLIIVGHSMAGLTIPEVCHRVPERIHRVIYLTTSNPGVGQSIADLMEHPLSPLSRGLGFDEMFCNDLDEETANWLKSNLQEDPPQPYSDVVKFCALPDGMPSTYIICTQDQALPVAYQQEQAVRAQVDEVIELESGHSAFASRPEALASLLLRYA